MGISKMSELRIQNNNYKDTSRVWKETQKTLENPLLEEKKT